MTAASLAKALNLSRTTVSLVLNGRAERYGLSPETVERVLDGARRLNYRPDPVARQLAGMRSNVIGILAKSSKLVDPRLIERMEVLAAAKKLRFIVGYATDDIDQVREYLHDFRGRRVEAVVSFHHNHPSYRGAVIDELQQMDRVVYYEKPRAKVRNPWFVEVDYYEMGRLAAQHLIDRGCKRIGLMGLDETIYPELNARRQGFEDAITKAGLPWGPELVWTVDQGQSLRWSEPPSENEAAAVVNELAVRQKVDGIFATNDLYAARLISVLRRMGRSVPDDIAVVGQDNMDISTLVDPQITTVDVRIDALAEATVNLLFEMLHGSPSNAGPVAGSSGEAKKTGGRKSTQGPTGRGIAVAPRLVVRQSA